MKRITEDNIEASKVKLEIYNVLSQRVEVLMDQICCTGYKSVRWDGSSGGMPIASGIYFYRFDAKGLTSGKQFHKVNKMMLLK